MRENGIKERNRHVKWAGDNLSGKRNPRAMKRVVERYLSTAVLRPHSSWVGMLAREDEQAFGLVLHKRG